MGGSINLGGLSSSGGVDLWDAVGGKEGVFGAIHDAVRDYWKDVTNDYIKDDKKLFLICESLIEAKSMLNIRIVELMNWTTDEESRFETIFGVTDQDSRKKIMDRMLSVNNNITNYLSRAHYKRDAPNTPKQQHNSGKFFETDDDSFAHVYSYDTDTEIFLDKLFWTSPLTGFNSKAGTLIHEISHFHGTKDHVYGKIKALALATKNSKKAMNNADNFEYYIEGLD